MRQEGGCCRISGLTHRSEDSICKQDRKSGPVSLYLITKMSSVTARCLQVQLHSVEINTSQTFPEHLSNIPSV